MDWDLFQARMKVNIDAFTVGHSSTSIGAALGMNIAFQSTAIQISRRFRLLAMVDSTAGMAYEALNHLGALRTNMLIILNDNEMSISPNVGAMSNYLTRMLSGRVFSTMRESSKRILKPMPPMWELRETN